MPSKVKDLQYAEIRFFALLRMTEHNGTMFYS